MTGITPRLEAKYSAMWNDAAAALEAATYTADSRPSHGDPRWGLSLVALVGERVAEEFKEPLASIRKLLSPHHLVYEPEDLHITVRSLEGYQREVPDEQIEFYKGQIRSCLRQRGELGVELAGLAGSPGGLFAPGYPNDELQSLRDELHRLGSANGPRAIASNDYKAVRDTAHVSLAVFQAPVVKEPAIVDWVEDHADAPEVTLERPELALVSYTLDHERIRMNVLTRF